ncbi:MAG: hypothetical protein U0586_00805 [Candidatus Brocadiaceae bacterium]
MTLTMLFDGTQHVVIASGAKQSFPHKQTSPPDKKSLDCEKLTKKEVFTE